jgi:hypothetical protein
MDPQDFIDKWRVSRRDLGALLDLKEAQIERWFFSKESKNYKSPKQSHRDRLAEIDLILTMRDTLQSASNSEALQRINDVIPPQKD